MNSKKFVGRDGIVVTEEMRVLISAAAIQLTFGLKKYMLDFLQGVIIYPDIYESKLMNADLKGGMSTSGILTIAWKYFEEGFENEHDNLNLGLHEFAHALELESEHQEDSSGLYPSKFDYWHRRIEVEYLKVKNSDEHYFRKYAGANIKEFFAVSVENFFENPEELLKQLPDVYYQISLLLNLDLVNNKDNDYIRKARIESLGSVFKSKNNKKNIEEQMILSSKHFNESWHWSFNLLLIGIFIGPLSLIFFTPSLFVPSGTILAIMVIIFIVAFVLQYNNVYKRLDMGLFFYSAYVFLGNSVFFLALILFFNQKILVGDVEEHVMLVSNVTNNSSRSSSGQGYDLSLYFVNDSYTSVSVTASKMPDFSKGVVICTRRGVFGLPIAVDCY